MNAFYYNPHEETEGFKGWYQRMCHKMNRKGIKYIVGEDANGNETITVYNPEQITDVKTEDGVAALHDPSKMTERNQLENPHNF